MEPATKKQEEIESPLEQLLEQVKQDAKREPDAYARETIVPEGGE